MNSKVAESRKDKIISTSFEYNAINCRAHSVSLKDFGGVGDGKTSNTKAFQAAISHLSQYASEEGSQLYVPAGKWLTGSFNLISHFTLYLHKDAVLLASQVFVSFMFFDD
jgi:polygalacturonase